jgi:hypothetical protein
MRHNTPVPGPLTLLRTGAYFWCVPNAVRGVFFVLLASLGSRAAHADFPKCEIRTGMQGAPAIVIDGKPVSPIFFSANNQFGRDEVLLQQLRLAHESGVNLFTINIPLTSSKTEIGKTLDSFCSQNSEGKFLVRCWLGPEREWLDAHPADRIKKSDGAISDMVSITSVPWLEYVDENLARIVSEIRESPYGPQCLGIILCYLQTGEWFYPDTNDYMDYSTANVLAYRGWLRRKYGSESSVTVNAEIPRPDAIGKTNFGHFRGLQESLLAIEYARFTSESMAAAIERFAKAVKKASKNRLLAGAFYGYTFELNGNGPKALAHSGHLAFARLLESPDIDLIHAPYSYFERASGQPGHLHLPIDSVALHGKLAIIEDDTFTHLAPPPDDSISAGFREKADTLAETLSLTRRNFGNFLMHRAGFWYFDIFSRGMWNDTEFWQSLSLQRRLAAEVRSQPNFEPEIAFVVSEDSVNYLGDDTHPLLLQSLYQWRSEIARIGAPVGFYLQSDLSHLPQSIKLAVLANPYVISKLEEIAIKKILKRGGTIVYVYAPGVIGPNGPDASRIASTTGLAIETQMDPKSTSIVSPITNERVDFDSPVTNPRFVVASKDIHVLATYEDSGEVAAAAHPVDKGVVVYTAVPRLPVGLLRWLAERSLVHLYSDKPVALSVAEDYLFVHADTPGPITFTWPKAVTAVERIVPYGRFTISEGEKSWNDALVAGTTFVYKCDTTPKAMPRRGGRYSQPLLEE